MKDPVFSQTLPNLPAPFDLILVEGGTFSMGDEYGDLWEACLPVHEVTMPDFYMGCYPVTQALWKAVMGNSPSHFEGDDRPVEQVSWDDAQDFIRRLNQATQATRPPDHLYRLPSEAEWEYAARGGKYHADGYKYAGSDRLKDVGWFEENSDQETKPVGQKDANPLGLYDMSGNVWEWCEDDRHDNYKGAPTDGSAWIDTPERGAGRVRRGGSWINTARRCRVAYRVAGRPGSRDFYLGLRLVLALQSVGRRPAFL
ncbi:MAG: formylglycine-generating enzyme family protein [Saprospiraceae bacterium]|nr:formylglycine-generating enzyme family protein [Saprospiraceae bacterium]